MKTVNPCKKVLVYSLFLVFVAMACVTSAAAQTVLVPVSGTSPTLTSVTINGGSGDQYDPHISGDWVAYTSDTSAPEIRSIRYYNFVTNSDAQIPMGLGGRDFLSDISGSKIVFSRITIGVKTAVMVFDAATPAIAPVEVDPAASTTRFWAAIGGNTVAYADFGLQANGELVVSDLVSHVSTRLTNDTAIDENPSVSPDGNVVTWEHCATTLTNCDIWQAVKTGLVWSVSVVAATTSPEGNPDSNGALVVYDSQRGGNSDIFWRPIGGGAEVQLQTSGVERNPSTAGNFIAFESAATFFDTSDIYVYDILANAVYQITNTPLVTEQLNDITLLPNGNLRVVWASDEDGAERNIKAATFSLPSLTPTPTQLLQQLIDTVATLNLRRGILNSFDAKLENAQAALVAAYSGNYSNACGMLGAFINEVQAQSGNALTVQEAAQLINLANQVRAGLACQ
jgi:Tol biopolymer transport system component